jgi:hypothetical protein
VIPDALAGHTVDDLPVSASVAAAACQPWAPVAGEVRLADERLYSEETRAHQSPPKNRSSKDRAAVFIRHLRREIRSRHTVVG